MIFAAKRVASESLKIACAGCETKTRYAVIRHPCDRLISAWCGVVVKRSVPAIVSYSSDGFSGFVYRVCEEVQDGVWNELWEPQFGFLAGRYDVLFRYDDLGSAWPWLAKKNGWGDLQKTNTSVHPDWTKVFTDDMIESVYWAYREDFSLGGWIR